MARVYFHVSLFGCLCLVMTSLTLCMCATAIVVMVNTSWWGKIPLFSSQLWAPLSVVAQLSSTIN